MIMSIFEDAVRYHPVVHDLGKFHVVGRKIPTVPPVRHLEEGRVGHLALEPLAKAEERGHEDTVKNKRQKGRQARGAGVELTRRRDAGVSP
jgi:hypothetical protein